MNLQPVLVRLTEAQNNFNSQAYAECFTETAIVHDEGKTHKGRAAVQQWIDKANQDYRATMKPLTYTEGKTENILTVETAGNFPGSPVVLSYHLVLENGLISSLKITG